MHYGAVHRKHELAIIRQRWKEAKWHHATPYQDRED
jgi:hypothetical protein